MQPKKSKFKKIFKWIILLLLLLIVVIIIIINFFPSKTEFVKIPIPEPKVSVTKQWQDPQGQPMIEKNYIFYGLNGLGYYQKELEKEQQKKIKDQNSNEIILLKHRLQTQKEPTDILDFVKQPFGHWYIFSYEISSISITFEKNILESLLANYISEFSTDEDGRSFSFSYKGPQYLLETDQDYFIGVAYLPFDPNDQLFLRKKYQLHFNPKRNTLSVYTDKFNTK
ncbi:ATP-dependent Zn protease domain protein [Candidatus Phytoplasma oryzae]|uniref:ATP-dependent Zn protease domain protein n=2 Tax=Candidatus Phytoplasma oryzae TaxID=203274 RepID=A0A139JQ23_9MOLU|nr:hypothetical protein [Candidatus Phytoplasma oryzae]KXT29059.1 ATP-dependent Zn protease domain protein [Candidatus Phytoplasma oryzae]